MSEEDGMESIAHRFLSAAVKVWENFTAFNSSSIVHLNYLCIICLWLLLGAVLCP